MAKTDVNVNELMRLIFGAGPEEVPPFTDLPVATGGTPAAIPPEKMKIALRKMYKRAFGKYPPSSTSVEEIARKLGKSKLLPGAIAGRGAQKLLPAPPSTALAARPGGGGPLALRAGAAGAEAGTAGLLSKLKGALGSGKVIGGAMILPYLLDALMGGMYPERGAPVPAEDRMRDLELQQGLQEMQLNLAKQDPTVYQALSQFLAGNSPVDGLSENAVRFGGQRAPQDDAIQQMLLQIMQSGAGL